MNIFDREVQNTFNIPTATYRHSVSCKTYMLKLNRLSPTHWGNVYPNQVGSSGLAVERLTVNRGDGGSIPPTAISKLRQFRSPHICLSF